ncbi:hypothetical protein C1859_15190 [Eggerthella lenta]|nr:hypothetical protein C1859_15190 [Eggerthella lenta]
MSSSPRPLAAMVQPTERFAPNRSVAHPATRLPTRPPVLRNANSMPSLQDASASSARVWPKFMTTL